MAADKLNSKNDVLPIKNGEGIVSTVASDSAYKDGPYKAPQTTPVLTNVNAETDTVESRLNKITQTDSNYITNAKQGAMRQANSRGLVNSSIAAGAGVKAGLDAALPIAQQDAETYNNTRFNNQNAQNEFLKNRQSADLNMETGNFQSGLNIGEMEARSALSNEENTLLNDLTMKRDAGLSELSIEEKNIINELEMKRDTASSGLRQDEAAQQSQLNIDRDKISADLNMQVADFESELSKSEEAWSVELKANAEKVLNDDKFSNDTKIQYVTAMNTIIRDANKSIENISLSERSADQQASAIEQVKVNRDAQIKVYEDLLSDMPGWQWSTDFTQGDTSVSQASPNTGSQSNLGGAIPENEIARYKDKNISPDGGKVKIIYGGNTRNKRPVGWESEDGRWLFNVGRGIWERRY